MNATTTDVIININNVDEMYIQPISNDEAYTAVPAQQQNTDNTGDTEQQQPTLLVFETPVQIHD